MNMNNYIKTRTTPELKAELRGLRQAIDKFECFGVSDLLLEEKIAEELERRRDGRR